MREGIKAMLSSEKMDWETPVDFFNLLNDEFNFTLDPSATVENAKCKKYYTKEDDGLKQNWDNERVFCNPPYGKEIAKWVKKASEARGGIVVLLIPARTDTKYFHKYIYHKSEIRFIKGRLKFKGNQKGSGPAPFPSAVIIFRKN